MSGAVAVVGASADRRKYGNKCVRAYASAGWRVYPINPHESEIEGLPVYRTLAAAESAAGGTLERISVYLPPEVTRSVLPEIAAAGAAATFFNPGSADAGVLVEAAALGIAVHDACSIVDIGLSPAQFSGAPEP